MNGLIFSNIRVKDVSKCVHGIETPVSLLQHVEDGLCQLFVPHSSGFSFNSWNPFQIQTADFMISLFLETLGSDWSPVFSGAAFYKRASGVCLRRGASKNTRRCHRGCGAPGPVEVGVRAVPAPRPGRRPMSCGLRIAVGLVDARAAVVYGHGRGIPGSPAEWRRAF